MAPVIETHNLCKYYRVGKEVIKAVDGVDLLVPDGCIFGLIGPNGAGKSTLIHLLMGIILPNSGSGEVLGYDIVKESIEIRKRVGFMPEGIGFYTDLTAEQNLRAVADLIGLEDKDKRVEECLRTVGLWNFKKLKYKEMSTGMKQRLGLAQALLKDPQLLILDEPTAGIDPQGAREFRDLVKELYKEGKTIFISTHLLYEIGPILTHIAIMNKGRITVQGGIDDIKEKLLSTQGYTYEIEMREVKQEIKERLSSIDTVKEVIMEPSKILVRCSEPSSSELMSALIGEEVYSFRLVRPSLEDVFRAYAR